MALFRLKKDTEKKIAPKESAPQAAPKSSEEKAVSAASRDLSSILKHPRVTEKATVLSESGVYTFDVSARTTKAEIAAAIAHVYGVTPVRINIASVPSKRVRMRSRNTFGKKAGGKKAYVYLKKGETIDTV